MIDIVEFAALDTNTRLWVAWGFLWRGCVISIGSAIGGGIAGGFLGLIAGLLGVAPTNAKMFALGGSAGLIVGFFFMWLYVHWLFRAQMAGYRLKLVKS